MIDNAFKRFYALGYKRLLPIVPVGAAIHEKSALAKRPKAVGKVPGIKRPDDGAWQSFDWIKHVTTEFHLDAWAAMGAGVGIRMGGGLVAVDIDTLDLALGNKAATAATELLGFSPNRVGRCPKRLKVYRCAEDLPYRFVRFADGSEKGGLVELLVEGKQFVAHGTHPQTGQPYEWRDEGPWPVDRLPEITSHQLDEFFARLVAELPEARATVETSPAAAKHVSQEGLKGDVDRVRRAVAAIPNDYPDRADYVRIMYAIKAATGEDGLEIFLEWCDRWTTGENERDVCEGDWLRAKPPFAVGAQYLYELAETRAPSQFLRDEAWLPAGSAPTDLNAFEALAAVEPEQPPGPEPITWRRPAEWSETAPPPREWEVRDWIPRREVTLLYGEGGIGKTLLIHQYATAAAAGLPWLGQETRPARVMAFFCEDSDDELHRRQLDICRHLGTTLQAVDDRLRIASRKYMDNLLAVWDRAGALRQQAVWRQLRDDALAFGAEVLIIDTIADTFGGSEIDRFQVNSFVKTVVGALAQAINGSVILLGHPSVGGRAEGRSGSTAWSNAARSRMYLRYPDGKDAGNVRELVGMKSNYGPKGAQINMQWERGAFKALAVRSPEADLNALKVGGLPTIEAVLDAAVVEAWEKIGHMTLGRNKRTKATYAPDMLRIAGVVGLAGASDADVLSSLDRLTARGLASRVDKSYYRELEGAFA